MIDCKCIALKKPKYTKRKQKRKPHDPIHLELSENDKPVNDENKEPRSEIELPQTRKDKVQQSPNTPSNKVRAPPPPPPQMPPKSILKKTQRKSIASQALSHPKDPEEESVTNIQPVQTRNIFVGEMQPKTYKDEVESDDTSLTDDNITDTITCFSWTKEHEKFSTSNTRNLLTLYSQPKEPQAQNRSLFQAEPVKTDASIQTCSVTCPNATPPKDDKISTPTRPTIVPKSIEIQTCSPTCSNVVPKKCSVTCPNNKQPIGDVKCSPTCPNNLPRQVVSNADKKCSPNCPNFTKTNKDYLKCSPQCANYSKTNKDDFKCSPDCPNFSKTNKDALKCSPNCVGNQSSLKCSPTCSNLVPKNVLSKSNTKCSPECPNALKSNENTIKCSPTCPNNVSRQECSPNCPNHLPKRVQSNEVPKCSPDCYNSRSNQSNMKCSSTCTNLVPDSINNQKCHPDCLNSPSINQDNMKCSPNCPNLKANNSKCSPTCSNIAVSTCSPNCPNLKPKQCSPVCPNLSPRIEQSNIPQCSPYCPNLIKPEDEINDNQTVDENRSSKADDDSENKTDTNDENKTDDEDTINDDNKINENDVKVNVEVQTDPVIICSPDCSNQDQKSNLVKFDDKIKCSPNCTNFAQGNLECNPMCKNALPPIKGIIKSPRNSLDEKVCLCPEPPGHICSPNCVKFSKTSRNSSVDTSRNNSVEVTNDNIETSRNNSIDPTRDNSIDSTRDDSIEATRFNPVDPTRDDSIDSNRNNSTVTTVSIEATIGEPVYVEDAQANQSLATGRIPLMSNPVVEQTCLCPNHPNHQCNSNCVKYKNLNGEVKCFCPNQRPCDPTCDKYQKNPACSCANPACTCSKKPLYEGTNTTCFFPPNNNRERNSRSLYSDPNSFPKCSCPECHPNCVKYSTRNKNSLNSTQTQTYYCLNPNYDRYLLKYKFNNVFDNYNWIPYPNPNPKSFDNHNFNQNIDHDYIEGFHKLTPERHSKFDYMCLGTIENNLQLEILKFKNRYNFLMDNLSNDRDTFKQELNKQSVNYYVEQRINNCDFCKPPAQYPTSSNYNMLQTNNTNNDSCCICADYNGDITCSSPECTDKQIKAVSNNNKCNCAEHGITNCSATCAKYKTTATPTKCPCGNVNCSALCDKQMSPFQNVEPNKIEGKGGNDNELKCTCPDQSKCSPTCRVHKKNNQPPRNDTNRESHPCYPYCNFSEVEIRQPNKCSDNCVMYDKAKGGGVIRTCSGGVTKSQKDSLNESIQKCHHEAQDEELINNYVSCLKQAEDAAREDQDQEPNPMAVTNSEIEFLINSYVPQRETSEPSTIQRSKEDDLGDKKYHYLMKDNSTSKTSLDEKKNKKQDSDKKPKPKMQQRPSNKSRQTAASNAGTQMPPKGSTVQPNRSLSPEEKKRKSSEKQAPRASIVSWDETEADTAKTLDTNISNLQEEKKRSFKSASAFETILKQEKKKVNESDMETQREAVKEPKRESSAVKKGWFHFKKKQSHQIVHSNTSMIENTEPNTFDRSASDVGDLSEGNQSSLLSYQKRTSPIENPVPYKENKLNRYLSNLERS